MSTSAAAVCRIRYGTYHVELQDQPLLGTVPRTGIRQLRHSCSAPCHTIGTPIKSCHHAGVKRSLIVNVLLALAIQAGVTALYFAVGRLGLFLAFKHVSISPVWPPTGLALALVLRYGYRCAVGIGCGAFFVTVSVGVPTLAGCAIGAGNALEAVVGCFLLRWVLGDDITNMFSKTRSTAIFLVLGVLLCTTISATIGVTTLCTIGTAEWSEFAGLWTIWWIGDAVGALLVTPVLFMWSTRDEFKQITSRLLEAGVLVVVSVCVSYLVFRIGDSDDAGEHAQVAVVIPILVWSILRFGVLGFTLIHMVVAGIAVWGTVSGHGPFYRNDVHHSLMVLQANIAIVGSTLLLMSVLVEERKNIELKFRSIQDELIRASRLRLVGETAAGVAHELNQPLVSITNFASGCQIRLKKGAISYDEFAEALDHIKASAMKASERTESIRAFIQDRESHFSQVEINSIIRDTIAFIRSESERHSISVEFVAAQNLPLVCIDEIQISQVFVNLLVNSIQSIAESQPQQHWVRIESEAPDREEVCVIVTDSGPGVPEDVRPQVFDQFFTTKPDGLGMGMAISKSIVEAHGGRLILEASPEGRTQFRVILPINPESEN